jgi:hypothetical protein
LNSFSDSSRVTLERREAKRQDSFGWLDLGVRFRYSRLNEAALFAAGVIGFQSIGLEGIEKDSVVGANSALPTAPPKYKRNT